MTITDVNLVNLDAGGIGTVLGDVVFPAPRWRVITEAAHWGASRACMDELTALEPRRYESLPDVSRAIHELRQHHRVRHFDPETSAGRKPVPSLRRAAAGHRS